MRRLVFTLALVLAPAVAHAQSPTVRDIIELAKAGLGEQVLLALIEVHRPVFPADRETLKALKDAGVPSSVIVAMVKSGREPAADEPVPQAAEPLPQPTPPQVVVVEREYEEPRVREVVVPYPVYLTYPTRWRHDSDHPRPDRKPAEPVYWGWGGKLRPDAWKPTVADIRKDAPKAPAEPQKK